MTTYWPSPIDSQQKVGNAVGNAFWSRLQGIYQALQSEGLSQGLPTSLCFADKITHIDIMGHLSPVLLPSIVLLSVHFYCYV